MGFFGGTKLASAPQVVTGISPEGGISTGGTSVVIAGTGFVGVENVYFGTTPATSFTVNSSTSITAVAPAGTASTEVDITVITTSATGLADQFTFTDPRVWGVSWNKGSNPTMTRTDSAVGLVANAGVDGSTPTNNFDSLPIFGEITQVTDTHGNTFIRIPKFYIKKTDGVGYKTWQVSKTNYSGYYLPQCFWNFTTGTELPYIDVGKYKASVSGGKLQSVSGGFPYINDTIVNFRTFAKANNTGVAGTNGYQQLDIHVVDMLQTLFYIEFATLNSQAIMQGWANGQYTATHLATFATTNGNQIVVANATAALYAVGQPIGIGTTQGGNQVCYGRTITAINTYDAGDKAIVFDGAAVNIAIGNMLYNVGWKNGFSSGIAASSGSPVSNLSGLQPCCYRGIESPWGDIWQFVDGLNVNNDQAWICQNAASYASNVFASPYLKLAYANYGINDWASAMGYDPANPEAEFPVTGGGSSSTYYSDYYYQNSSGQYIALLGGDWGVGSGAGFSCWGLYGSSGFTVVYVGGRLLRKAL
jgi:hypothetical protein